MVAGLVAGGVGLVAGGVGLVAGGVGLVAGGVGLVAGGVGLGGGGVAGVVGVAAAGALTRLNDFTITPFPNCRETTMSVGASAPGSW